MTAPGPPASGSLRGRRAELSAMSDRLRAGAAGSSALIVIEGPIGSGKTTLLESAVRMGLDEGLGVARGSYEADDLAVPASPILGALGLASEQSKLNTFDTQLFRVEQVTSLLEERAARSPLLLVLDAVELASPASLLAVRRLILRTASYPIVWLLAVREEQIGSLLRRILSELQSHEGATALRLGPLSRDAVAELVGDLTGAQPDPALVSFVQSCADNPLGVIEITDTLLNEGAISLAQNRSSLAVTPAFESVEQLISSRLDTLSPAGRQLVEVASVFGRSFRVQEVARALGVPASQLLPALRETRQAGLFVATASEDFRFRNDLIRHAVYNGLDAPVRIALHREIGELLLQSALASQAAAHLLIGTQSGDGETLRTLDEAVSASIRSAPQSAVELALHSLDLTETGDPRRLDRTLGAVAALEAAERIGEAQELARSSLSPLTFRGSTPARLRISLSRLQLMTADTTAAIASAENVLGESGLPMEIRSGAAAARLMGVMATGDLSRTRMLAETAVADAYPPIGDDVLIPAMIALASVSWAEGRVAAALGLQQAAVRRSDQVACPERNSYPRLDLVRMLAAVGRFDDAEIALTECQEEIELGGNTLYRAAPAVACAGLRLARGQLNDARTEAEAGYADAERLGTRYFSAPAQRLLASVAISRGDLRTALGHLETAASDSGFAPRATDEAAWPTAQLVRLLEGPTRSVEALSGVYDNPSGHKGLLLQEPAAAAWLVRTSLAAGNRDRANALAACADQLAADNRQFPTVIASATQARGVIDRDMAALDLAATEHRHPWASASATEDAGVAAAETGARAEARERFEVALGRYGELGYDGDAARVRSRLRGMGVRRRHWRQVGRPVSGWESITETELRVATLVSEGLTNPQVAARMYLSRHTVDFHLRQIFRKLSIASRVELTRLTLEKNSPPPEP